jgi:thiol-disulfide isomerase/thioredoxin
MFTHPPALVYYFVNSDCPIARRYSPEMARIAKEHEREGMFKIVFCDPKFTKQQATKHCKEFGLNFSFLLDANKMLAKRNGIKTVPTAVIIYQGKVAYRGRIDDAYGSDYKWRKPKQFDLRNALEAIRLGRPIPIKETTPIGCHL